LRDLQKLGVLPPNLGGETPYSAGGPAGAENPRVNYSTYTADPVSNIRIIPALPSPQSGRIYRLRVGNDTSVEGASLVSQQLMKAGFQVVQEQAGAAFRVYAVGIPAPSVYSAAQRLGAIGFDQVWIYEQ